MSKSKTIKIYVGPAFYDRLATLCDYKGEQSMSAFCRAAMQGYVTEVESKIKALNAAIGSEEV